MPRARTAAHLAGSSLMVWASCVYAETYSLRFEAPAGCASRQGLIDQVSARTALAAPVAKAGDYQFELALGRRTPHEKSVLGSLFVQRPDGKRSTRSVDGGTCEEVVAAMALIMALTIDPGAQSGPIENLAPSTAPAEPIPNRPSIGSAAAPEANGAKLPPGDDTRTSLGKSTLSSSNEVSEGSPLPAPDSTPRNPSTSTDTASVPASPRDTVPPANLPASNAAPRRSDNRRRTTPQTKSTLPNAWSSRITTGAQVDWSSQLAPTFGMTRVGAHLTYRSNAGPVATLTGLWGPTTRRSRDGTAASFAYYGGTLEAGWPVFDSGSLELGANGAVSLGRLSGEGVAGGRIDAPRHWDATWVAVAPGADLTWMANWGGFSFRTAMSVGVVRPSFSIQGADSDLDPFFEVPMLGLEVALRWFLRLERSPTEGQ